MSNAKCCVPGCENSAGSHVTLHRFPNPDKNLALFNVWVSTIGGHILELENNHIFKYRRVCHLHFEEQYWCRNNRISNIAIPTLNMSGSSLSSDEITAEIQSLRTSSEAAVSNIEGPLSILPEFERGKRKPLMSIENVIKPSTSSGPLTSPEPGCSKWQPLMSIENVIEPSSSVLCKETTLKVATHKKRRSFASMAEHHLYKKLVTLGVKLSKCRSKQQKGIIPPECTDTADILLFFDKLFDSVNGSYSKKNRKHGKPLLGPVTPNSVHFEVWRESKKTLKEMRFINSSSGQAEHVPTLQNWVWTLEGIELLLKNLKENYDITSVWLRHLNQDPIENFFGAIRSNGYRNINPTPERFETAFTTLLVNNLSNVHAPGANCENDQCEMLNELVITKRKAMLSCNIEKIPDIEITPLEEKNDPRQIGGLQYVAGYFLKKNENECF